MKQLLGNTSKTRVAILEILADLERESDEFRGLAWDKKFQLSMQFYQCARARLQKGKMIFDVLGPAIVFALGRWLGGRGR
jgi:hypothetical protein